MHQSEIVHGIRLVLAAYNPERPLSASRGVEVIDLFLRRRQRRKMLVWDGCTSRGIGRSLITAYFPAGELQFSIAFVVCVGFSVAFFLLCHNRHSGFSTKNWRFHCSIFFWQTLGWIHICAIPERFLRVCALFGGFTGYEQL